MNSVKFQDRNQPTKISCTSMWSESCSVVSNSLRPHGLYRPWNSPHQNTGVGSHSLLQGIFPTQGSNPGLPHRRWILYQLSHKGSPRILEWVACHSPADLPNPGIELGSPALQANSLPTELSGKPSPINRQIGNPQPWFTNFSDQNYWDSVLKPRLPGLLPESLIW